ncbi:hypothetical protein BOX15_Mlig025930g1 [Macrostomum lignano]|uniref:Long-chain-fatty-acid--CoA ligase n=1 Tax=Macrostomum lignano TaxID=282301 RepID=A0A267F8T6_9PLAT|nr:hypothetical protein BOX15_Mlig025930g1 [Macrostomum lignano]
MSDWAEAVLTGQFNAEISTLLLPGALLLAPLLVLLELTNWRRRLLDLCLAFQRDAFYHLASLDRPSGTPAAAADVLAAFESTAAALPDKACFIADEEVWSFGLVADLATRLATYLARRLPTGAAVGVAVRPSALHTALWLGAAKAGCLAVLLDPDDPGDADADACMRRRRLRRLSVLVYEADAETVLLSALPMLRHLRLLLSCHGEPDRPPRLPGALRLEAELLAETENPALMPPLPRQPDHRAPLLVATEAGRQLALTHADYLQIAALPRLLLELGREDVLYICQPLHTALATAAGVGLAITEGATCVLRSDCSPIGYWTDCARHGCTAGLYDAALAAELVRRPGRPTDRLHSTTRLLGRGLPSGCRQQLVERFGLDEVVELGGACAGAPAFLASDNAAGSADCGANRVSVGFRPLWLPGRAPVRLLRLSADSGLPDWDCRAGCREGDSVLPLFPNDGALSVATAAERPNRLAGVFQPGDDYRHWLGSPLTVGRLGNLTDSPDEAPPVHQGRYWLPGKTSARAELQSILSNLLPECGGRCQLSCIAAQPQDDGHLAAGEVAYTVPNRDSLNLPPEADSGDLEDFCRQQLGRRIKRAFESRLPCYARPRVVRIGTADGDVIGQYEVCPDSGDLLDLSDADYRLLRKDLRRLWRSTDHSD